MSNAVRLAIVAFLAAGTAVLGGCNNETPSAKVGSGAGQTDNTGAPSGRVTTQGEAQATGSGR